jgi:hypothetical protein
MEEKVTVPPDATFAFIGEDKITVVTVPNPFGVELTTVVFAAIPVPVTD